jgi:hypothetical protein
VTAFGGGGGSFPLTAIDRVTRIGKAEFLR